MQITKMDAEKMELLTSFLLDFLEYLRAAEGDGMMHKKVICHDFLFDYTNGVFKRF